MDPIFDTSSVTQKEGTERRDGRHTGDSDVQTG